MLNRYEPQETAYEQAGTGVQRLNGTEVRPVPLYTQKKSQALHTGESSQVAPRSESLRAFLRAMLSCR